MLNSNCIIEEVKEKYSEWFEMMGENSPSFMCNILASLLLKERSKVNYLEKRLDHIYKTSQR